MGAGGLPQRLRHRPDGPGALPEDAASEHYKEESDVLPQPRPELRERCSTRRPASSRAETPRATGGWTPRAYDPRVWGYDYTETNGWGYAFTAPQDSRGLANLYGGRAASADKLDTYFATPETAAPEFVGSYGGVIHEMTEARDVRMGMYGHSNQVAHHVTYMYDAAGAALEDPGEGPRGPVPPLHRQRDRPGLPR